MAEDVDYVGIGKLRQRFTTNDLESLRRPIAIMSPRYERPLGVILQIDQYNELVRWALIGRSRRR